MSNERIVTKDARGRISLGVGRPGYYLCEVAENGTITLTPGTIQTLAETWDDAYAHGLSDGQRHDGHVEINPFRNP